MEGSKTALSYNNDINHYPTYYLADFRTFL